MDPARSNTDQPEIAAPDRRSWGWLTVLAVLWMVGLCIGRVSAEPAVGLGIAGVVVCVAVWMVVRGRLWPGRCWGAVAVVAVGSAWMPLRSQVPADDVSHFAGEQGQLADLIGIVDGQVSHVMSPEKGLDRFLTRPPATRFVLAVERIVVDGVERSASGRVMVRVSKHDHRLRPGGRIWVTGWLRRISGPSNPGQFDYRRFMAGQGVHSALNVPERENWKKVDDQGVGLRIVQMKEAAARAAAESLHLGMRGRHEAYDFMAAVLLGHRGTEFAQLYESFKEVGLAHFLAISGAHLGALLGLTWLAARMVVPHPRYGAVLIVVVLVGFLLVVPLRVPIVRAGIMSFVFTVAFGSGRLVRRLDLLSLAALILLIWRPVELFGAGFQLSFAVTAAILVYAKSASYWLWPEPEIRVGPRGVGSVVLRGLVNYVAVTLVATSVALPIVAVHFGLLTPLSAVISVLAIPIGVVVLGLGYLKTVVGLVLPSAGAVLAGPTAFVAEIVVMAVRWSGELPGASIHLVTVPSLAWVSCVLFVVCAFWGGWFRGRPVALGGVLLLCTLWFVVATRPVGRVGIAEESRSPVVMRVDMLSVADGSAYLLRVPAVEGATIDRGPGHVVLFDCGSLTYKDVGHRVIVPALKALGVGRVDTIVLSHANLDHYNGCLPVVEQMGVERVITTRRVMAEAGADPLSPIGEFMRLLRGLGVEPEVVAQGWKGLWGGAKAEVLWPREGVDVPEANDSSIVLRVETAGRRVVLNGDIQEFAIGALLKAGVDMKADVCDLPHHGSFVYSSPEWLAAVSPRLVMQSTSERRMLNDRWAVPLPQLSVERAVTAVSGHVAVELLDDGVIVWEGYLEGGGVLSPLTLEAVGEVGHDDH